MPDTTATKEITNTDGEVVARPAPDDRPIKIQLIEKFAFHVEAGGLEDMEKARLTLSHPAFNGMPRFNADENYQELEQMREVLAWCEDPEHNKGDITQRLAELEAEREQIEARIERDRRALAANREEYNRRDTVRARWAPIADSIPGRFARCPILHFLPAITERIKALGLRVPPRPNF